MPYMITPNAISMVSSRLRKCLLAVSSEKRFVAPRIMSAPIVITVIIIPSSFDFVVVVVVVVVE